MYLTRIVLAALQYQRGEIGLDIFKLALEDFIPQLSDEALGRLANQLSKLEPAGL